MKNIKLGKYLTLTEFCTCTQTYRKYLEKINPYPQNLAETLPAIKALNQKILDPIIDCFGLERFQLTYGFCSADLKKYLAQKDPVTGIKNGKVSPDIDQHMSMEINSKGNFHCKRPGAACDFQILGLLSAELVNWILEQKLPFDSLYFYGNDRPIHISYGPEHKRDIRTFTVSGVPTQQGITAWVRRAKLLK